MSVYLGLLARVRDVTRADIEQALYIERSLLKMLGMRRTMFVVPPDLAVTMNSGATVTIAARERRRTIDMVASAGVVDGDAEKWLNQVEEQTVAALDELGEATASQLTEAGRRLASPDPIRLR